MKSKYPGAAHFSPCKLWRYWLTRVWDESKPVLVVVGLNPSTATEDIDDRTIRKCIHFAQAWGYGSLLMLNIFAFRATDPDDMRAAPDPIGPENDAILREKTEGRRVLCAWGGNGDFKNRDLAVLKILEGRDLVALKVSENTGHPWHPLYMPNATQPMPFKGRVA